MGYSEFDYRFKPISHGNGLCSQPSASEWENQKGDAFQSMKPMRANPRSEAKKKWWAEKKAREAKERGE